MHVLITGGAGFIGSHLADLHMANGDTVTIVDDMSTGTEKNLVQHIGQKNFFLHQAPIENWDLLDSAVGKAERIYHLAAVVGVKHVLENPVQVISVNQSATERLLQSMAAQQSRASVIIASSSEVYGDGNHKKFNENDNLVIPSIDKLRWCYAVTKLADEMLAFAYHHQYGLRTVTVRLFNTIGPRQKGRYGMVVPHLVAQAVRAMPLTVYGAGSQSRSFCDVRDTVRMLDALAANEKSAGLVVNVGNDREISITSLAELIKERACSTSPVQHISYENAYGLDFHDIQHRCPDVSLLHSLTHINPQYALEDTIDDLILSCKRHNEETEE